jgi:hypothetical protein
MSASVHIYINLKSIPMIIITWIDRVQPQLDTPTATPPTPIQLLSQDPYKEVVLFES